MPTITFTCEVITPMFLAGADGKTPELRPPSIKGALRFWWRAVNGHLGLKELKEREGEIFGSTERRSRVIVRVGERNLNMKTASLVPHKPYMKGDAFAEKGTFDVILSMPNEIKTANKVIFTFDQLKHLFILTCTLGGFGKRVRRGMGSVQVKQHSIKSLEEINQLINKVAKRFSIKGRAIYSNFGSRTERYPYIKQIELGRQDRALLEKTSYATHDIKKVNRANVYENALGHASGGRRFASPIYTSVIKIGNNLHPIITTLNTVSGKRAGYGIEQVQKDFKNKIL